jgi:hypothetical protein
VAVGVWTGNNDNSPMRKGSSISGKPWRAFMDEVIDEYDNDSFRDYELPENFDELPPVIRGQWEGGDASTVLVDTRTGRPANAFTPDEFVESVVRFEPHTILHWIDKDNPTRLNISTGDAQYENWEASVQAYARENFQAQYRDNDDRFEDIDEVDQREEGDFELNIVGIFDGEEFELSDRQRISTSFDGISLNDLEEVEFYVNNIFIDSDESQPFNSTLNFDEVPGIGYENILQLIAIDEDDRFVSEDLIFIIPELQGVEAGEQEFEFTEVEPSGNSDVDDVVNL